MPDKYVGTEALNELVSKIKDLLNLKQDVLTFDTTPTSGSTNPVTSGGIYNAISGIVVNDGTLTITVNNTSAGTFSANQSSNNTINIPVPTTTSQLTNNSGFITNTVNDLVNYYTKSETYTKTEVANLIAGITTVTFQIVQTLPTADASTYFNTSKVIYMLQQSGGKTGDYYQEYITVRTGTDPNYTYSWELIGDTKIDLSGYVPTSRTIAGVDLVDNITKSELLTALNVEDGAQVNKIEIVKVNGSTLTIDTTDNSVNITVPVNLSDLQDDATHRLVTDTQISTWNAKQDAITGAASTITSNNLTTGRVVISNSSGKIDTSSITTTKLGYLTDVTSNIQSQINSKQDTLTAGSNITITTVDNNLTISATDTTYSSLPAASGGTSVSLVTTGEKYTWNSKATTADIENAFAGRILELDILDIMTAQQAAALMTPVVQAQTAPVTVIETLSTTITSTQLDGKDIIKLNLEDINYVAEIIFYRGVEGTGLNSNYTATIQAHDSSTGYFANNTFVLQGIGGAISSIALYIQPNLYVEKIGSASLTTTAQTLSAAVNELDSGKQDNMTAITTSEVDALFPELATGYTVSFADVTGSQSTNVAYGYIQYSTDSGATWNSCPLNSSLLNNIEKIRFKWNAIIDFISIATTNTHTAGQVLASGSNVTTVDYTLSADTTYYCYYEYD